MKMKNEGTGSCGSCLRPFDGVEDYHGCSGCEQWVCNDCKVNDQGNPACCSGTCKRCRGMLLPFVATLPAVRPEVRN